MAQTAAMWHKLTTCATDNLTACAFPWVCFTSSLSVTSCPGFTRDSLAQVRWVLLSYVGTQVIPT